MPTAAAIAGSAVIGGVAAERAGKRAEKGAERAQASIEQAARQARQDVFNLFPQAKQELLAGAQGAFNVLGQGIPLQQQQLSQGNLAAQRSISGGFDRAQAALLGLPVEQFETAGVEFSPEPFLGGESLFNLPQKFVSGGQQVSLPTFAGLGGTVRPPTLFPRT